MLVSIDIKDFALIHNLYLELGEGLNIITGETGAGKSIVVDSINFVLGARFNKSIIKKGENCAFVTANFTLTNELSKAIEPLNVDEDLLTLHRSITVDGKSVCRVDGKIVPLKTLKKIGEVLMEIHGQHENQFLFHKENHLDYLDKFCLFNGAKVDYLAKFKEDFKTFITFRKRILKDDMDVKVISSKIKDIELELKDFAALKWEEGKEESLSKKILTMQNAQEILKNVNLSYSLLSDNEYNVVSSLNESVLALQNIKSFNKDFETALERLETAVIEIQDVAMNLATHLSGDTFDLNALDKMESSLFEFQKLKKKHGKSEEELLKYFSELDIQKDSLNDLLLNADKLRKELRDFLIAAKESATVLSEKRKINGADLEIAVNAQLEELGMKNAKFKVGFTTKELGKDGIDSCEFLLSSNKGQDFLPINQVASGGEISRLMLILKDINNSVLNVPSMIFDEIDTGISGKTALSVSVKIGKIAKEKQVICVTHLPQVAAMSKRHIFVDKQETVDGVEIVAKVLNEKEKENEVARLFSGDTISNKGLEFAKELIDYCNNCL